MTSWRKRVASEFVLKFFQLGSSSKNNQNSSDKYQEFSDIVNLMKYFVKLNWRSSESETVYLTKEIKLQKSSDVDDEIEFHGRRCPFMMRKITWNRRKRQESSAWVGKRQKLREIAAFTIGFNNSSLKSRRRYKKCCLRSGCSMILTRGKLHR